MPPRRTTWMLVWMEDSAPEASITASVPSGMDISERRRVAFSLGVEEDEGVKVWVAA